MTFHMFHRLRLCPADRVDLICSWYSWWEGLGLLPQPHCPWVSIVVLCHLCMWVVRWGLLLRLPWRTWVCPCEAQVWRWCSCLGRRGSGSTRYSGGWQRGQQEICCSWYGNQCWPISSSILAWRTPLWQRYLAGHLYRVTKSWTRRNDPVHIDPRQFLLMAALPQWRLSVKVVQLLGLWGPWQRQECRDMDLLCRRSHAPAEGLFFLERLVARGQKASLAGLSP